MLEAKLVMPHLVSDNRMKFQIKLLWTTLRKGSVAVGLKHGKAQQQHTRPKNVSGDFALLYYMLSETCNL